MNEEFTPPHLTSVEGNEAAQARLQLVRDYKRRIEAEGSLLALEQLRNEFWQSLELHHFDKQSWSRSMPTGFGWCHRLSSINRLVRGDIMTLHLGKCFTR
jgi:hypothetical protein